MHFAGNLWYFYEARSLAKKENRQNVTAQPFGIGASQLTGWLYLIMGPVYWQTGDAELAFQIGLAAAVDRRLCGGFRRFHWPLAGKRNSSQRADGEYGVFCHRLAVLCRDRHGIRPPGIRFASLIHHYHRLSGKSG